MNRMIFRFVVLTIVFIFPFAVHVQAQATLGSINGTVTDKSGAVVQGASVKVRNNGTNLEQTISTRNDGSFSDVDLPIGTYSVTVSKDGFKTEVFTSILVRGGLTTTVNASLIVGQVSATVTVEATPLMNQTDTSNGYTLGSELVENIPLERAVLRSLRRWPRASALTCSLDKEPAPDWEIKRSGRMGNATRATVSASTL